MDARSSMAHTRHLGRHYPIPMSHKTSLVEDHESTDGNTFKKSRYLQVSRCNRSKRTSNNNSKSQRRPLTTLATLPLAYELTNTYPQNQHMLQSWHLLCPGPGRLEKRERLSSNKSSTTNREARTLILCYFALPLFSFNPPS